MDGERAPGPVRDAPFRDPRYAPRSLEVVPRSDGALVLLNTTPWSDRFATTNAALDHWAKAAPDRLWIAERNDAEGGEGWRSLTFAAAQSRIASLATALLALGLGPDRPLLILARNGIETVIPEAQGCCGALSMHTGAADQARLEAELVAVPRADRLECPDRLDRDFGADAVAGEDRDQCVHASYRSMSGTFDSR